jgi:hypothetical protein
MTNTSLATQPWTFRGTGIMKRRKEKLFHACKKLFLNDKQKLRRF